MVDHNEREAYFWMQNIQKLREELICKEQVIAKQKENIHLLMQSVELLRKHRDLLESQKEDLKFELACEGKYVGKRKSQNNKLKAV